MSKDLVSGSTTATAQCAGSSTTAALQPHVLPSEGSLCTARDIFTALPGEIKPYTSKISSLLFLIATAACNGFLENTDERLKKICRAGPGQGIMQKKYLLL